MILPITLTIAGAAALLNIWMAVRIGRLRIGHRVSIGDGGHEMLTRRMRAQANFVEYTPIFLILLGLVELARGSAIWLWIVGIVYVLGRILHVFGMDRGTSPLRTVGIAVTLLSLLGLALYAIAIPYLEGAQRPSISYAASPSSGGTNAS